MVGGMLERHYLSAGQAAMQVDSDGVPFDMSHIYASGNLAAGMSTAVTAEATGRILATRLYEMTDDPGMKDMLSFPREHEHGTSLDRAGEFHTEPARPEGGEPTLSTAPPESYAQREQIAEDVGGLVDRVKDAVR
jgi:Mn-containing catalase